MTIRVSDTMYDRNLAVLRQLKQIHEDELMDLYDEFAMEQNPLQQGDIVEDANGFVRVDSVGYTKFNFGKFSRVPMMSYSGTILNKKLKTKKLSKGGGERVVLSENIVSVIRDGVRTFVQAD